MLKNDKKKFMFYFTRFMVMIENITIDNIEKQIDKTIDVYDDSTYIVICETNYAHLNHCFTLIFKIDHNK